MLPSLCADVMADTRRSEAGKASGPLDRGGREGEGGEMRMGRGSKSLAML